MDKAKTNYLAPNIEAYSIAVEQGYTASTDYNFGIDGWQEGESFDGKGEYVD